MIKLSVVVTLFDEEEAFPMMYPLLLRVLHENMSFLFYDYEIVLVDDGSMNGTPNFLIECARANPRVNVVTRHERGGKTTALRDGLENATGDLIVLIDGDGQDDSEDIPKLVQKLHEGYDFVNGYRAARVRDDAFVKSIPSLVFNKIVKLITRTRWHDQNSPFKAFKRGCLKDIDLSREGMHRYMLPIISKKGYKIAEVPVRHSPRKYGKSKYVGAGRFIEGLRDLIRLKLEGKI